MEYKGYKARISFDDEDKIFVGKVVNSHDSIHFESGRESEIQAEFHKAVDDYLDYCQKIGESPSLL